MGEQIIETKKYTTSVFRICRKKDIEKIGFGESQYYETDGFCKNLQKHGLKGARLRKIEMCASQFTDKNKGYPKGFKSRTYNEKRDFAS